MQIDSGGSALGAYAIYSTSTNEPLRVLLYNSEYFDGSESRNTTSVDISGLSSSATSFSLLRMTAPLATSLAPDVSIGGSSLFDSDCAISGIQSRETVSACGGLASIEVSASEAAIVYLS